MSYRALTHAAFCLLLCCSSLAAEEGATTAAEELRAAEIAFAASVAERDAERFASFLDEDAVFASGGVLRGREAIVQGWSLLFAEEGPRLTWQPELVEVRPDGLGLSRGPYTMTMTGPDGAETTSSGQFMSIWRRDEAGDWKVLFDSGCPPCPACSSPDG